MTTFIIILVVIVLFIAAFFKIKYDEKLKQEYFSALRGTNKSKALKAGRAYYSSLRKGQALTIYDEQAINNDINTMRTETTSSTPKQVSGSVLDKLERLGQLKAQGILTEEEFNKQKEKILNE